MKKPYKTIFVLLLFFAIISQTACSKEDTTSDLQQIEVAKVDTATSTDIQKESNDNNTESNNKNLKEDNTQVIQVKNQNNSAEKQQDENKRNKAIEYNSIGFDLYEKEKYEEALEYFEKSYKEDDTYYLGHYNYACTLGVLMKQDYPRYFGFKNDIIDHLKKVIELHPAYIEKIKTDPDLSNIRGEFDYYLLIGLSPNKTEDVKVILSSLPWYKLGSGIIPVEGSMSFNDDGTFTLWYNPPNTDISEIDKKEDLKYNGTYEVNGNNITLHLNEKMLRKRTEDDIYHNESSYEDTTIIKGKLLEDGSIKFDIFDYSFYYWYPEFSA